MRWGSYVKSSLHDMRCCDETVTVVNDAPVAWRALTSSLTCVLNSSGKKTGYVHVATLEQYNTTSGVATGTTKPNVPSDPDYIADYINTTACPVDADGGTPDVHYTSFYNYTGSQVTVTCAQGSYTIVLPPNSGTTRVLPADGQHDVRAYSGASAGTGSFNFVLMIDGSAHAAPGFITVGDVNFPVYNIEIRPSNYVPPVQSD